jgi:capsular polysaccharide biosynthesis protein/Flp pilus assembly protein TadD
MQNFMGFDASAMIYNRQYTIGDALPAIRTFENARVSRIRASAGGDVLEDLSGGAFTSAGEFIEASAQPRSDGRNAIRLAQARATAAPGNHLRAAVFGGVAFDHFGHFLLETTARLWCLPEYQSLPWLFLTDGRPGLKSYQMDFLQLLGLGRDQIIPVSDWLAVEALIIPEPAFVYHHYASYAYRDMFRRARCPQEASAGRRIFVSRGNTSMALTVGERELEALLAEDGWEIAHPETLPAAAQAALFRGDNILLGLQGSAMHLGLFAPPGRQVVHLCRGQAYRGYYLLDDLMSAEATYFQAMREPPLPSKPISGPFMLDLDGTVGFLRAQGLLRGPAIAVGGQGSAWRAAMAGDYEAWWHYTESQTRLHRGIADDGTPVPPESALAPALAAVALRPDNAEMLAHAASLLLKFEGVDSADALLARHERDDAPPDARLLHVRSLVQDLRGDYAAALITAQAACALQPDHPTHVQQHATILFRLGRLPEACALLESLIARGSALAFNHMLLSLVLEQAGDLPGALAAAREAARLDGPDESSLRRLVALLREAGEAAASWSEIAHYLEEHAGSTDLLLEIAAHRRGAGDVRAEGMYLARALAAAPEDAAVQAFYVQNLIGRGLFPDLAFLGTEPEPAVCEQAVMIYRRSLDLMQAGRVAEALPVAVIAAELFGNNITIMQHLIGLLLINQRPGDARLLVNLLIARQRATGEIYYALSLIEAAMGRSLESCEAARMAAELAPGNITILEHYQRLAAEV